MIPKPPPGAVPGQITHDVSSMMEQGFAQQAQQQKTNIQQSPQLGNLSQQSAQTQQFQHQQSPRDVGSPIEEAQMAVGDIKDGLFGLPVEVFNEIKAILGLKRQPKNPQETAKLKQFHHSWQQLDGEQQAVAQQRLQAETQRKEMMKQEDEMKKQQELEMKKQKEFKMPQGKVSGQAALDKMNKDRKGMGGASG